LICRGFATVSTDSFMAVPGKGWRRYAGIGSFDIQLEPE